MYQSYAHAMQVLERTGKNPNEWMASGSGRNWTIVRRPAPVDHEALSAKREAEEAKVEKAIVELFNQLPDSTRLALPLPF